MGIKAPVSRRGLSMLEVLLAASVLAVALLALIGVEISSLRASQGSTDRHTASVIATSIMGECEAALRENFFASVAQPRAPVAQDTRFERQVLEDLEAPQLKRVEVVVWWLDRNGARLEYHLLTRVLKNGA